VLAEVLRGQERYAEAEDLLRDAIDRGIEDVFVEYGDLLVELGRPVDAATAYRRGIQANDPDAANALEQLSAEDPSIA
jgi:predicted negative regulator of RcsB-dependent stress response